MGKLSSFSLIVDILYFSVVFLPCSLGVHLIVCFYCNDHALAKMFENTIPVSVCGMACGQHSSGSLHCSMLLLERTCFWKGLATVRGSVFGDN